MCASFLVNPVFPCSPSKFSPKDLVFKAYWLPYFGLSQETRPPSHRVGLADTWGHCTWVWSTDSCSWGSRAPFYIVTPVPVLLPGTPWGLTRRAMDSLGFYLCKSADKKSRKLQKTGWWFVGLFYHRILKEGWARLGRLLGGATSWSSAFFATVSGKGCWKQKTHRLGWWKACLFLVHWTLCSGIVHPFENIALVMVPRSLPARVISRVRASSDWGILKGVSFPCQSD